MKNPANPFALPPETDPFFSQPSDPRREQSPMEPERRTAVRYAHSFNYLSKIFGYYVVIILGSGLLLLAVVPVLMIFYHISRGNLRDLLPVLVICVACVLSWWFFLPLLLQSLRMTKATEMLAARLGGSAGKNRGLLVLDWLDANWKADAPIEVLHPPGPVPMEERWDIQAMFQGKPLLVHVHQRMKSRHSHKLARISLYLSAIGAAPPDGFNPAPAQAELANLGFWVRQMKGGVFACTREFSTEVLAPDRIHRALEAMNSLITGQPMPSTPLLKGFSL